MLVTAIARAGGTGQRTLTGALVLPVDGVVSRLPSRLLAEVDRLQLEDHVLHLVFARQQSR